MNLNINYKSTMPQKMGAPILGYAEIYFGSLEPIILPYYYFFSFVGFQLPKVGTY